MSKRKSGHEKLREKNIKLLRKDAKTTKNLLSMFSKLNSNTLQHHADAEPDDEVQSHVAKETQRNLDDEDGVYTDTNEMTQPILILNITASSSMVEPTGDNEKTTTRVNDWFNKPHLNKLTTFYKYHPHQPETRHFNSKMVYYRPEDGMQRMFLSFSEEEECLFCSVCLAHGNEKQKPSSFVTGFNSWTHIHQRIVEHESSKRHQECVEAYLHFSANRTILDMVQGQQYSLRKQQVLHRRLIVDRVVSIVKVIGKRGMPYRGKAGCEAVNVLANDRVDHGTFLEIVILVAKYDEILKAHLKEIIDKGMLNDKQDKRNRANRNTFISKSTVNQIILGIAKLMKSAIAEEVQQAGIFSVQLDTTQDVTQADKCAIVLRYVTDKVEERLIGVVDSHSGKGSDLCKLMSNVLEQNGIDITKCVSDSTDGASNMAGAYNGFTTFLEKASPGHIHTWCYADVLNLVVCDATSSNEASMTLFGILQKAAMFFRESYLRMDLWTDHMKEKNGQNIHKRLSVIGATRWGSKHDALQKFFGTFRDGEGALYTDVVQVLEIAVSSTKLSVEARYDAQCLLTSLLKYKTVLTGFVYLRIMESTTPLSKYLQTSELNFIKAFEMVKVTISEIQTQSRNFDQVKVAADHFINVSATILDEKECDCVIQTDLPMVRKRIRKVMARELENDDPLTDPLKIV